MLLEPNSLSFLRCVILAKTPVGVDKLNAFMTTKKITPAPRKSAKKNAMHTLRRTAIWLIASAALAFQVASCGGKADLPASPSTTPQEQAPGISTSFKDCRQFFAEGVAPIVPKAPLLRELCYDSFAVLHSGTTKTPVFVAQRLNRASVADAD